MNNITNLIRIPSSVKVFAKYIDGEETFYVRCYFIAICDDGYIHFAELDDCTCIANPEEVSNFIGFEIIDEEKSDEGISKQEAANG